MKIYIIFFALFLSFFPVTAQSQEIAGRGLFIWSLEDVPVLSSKLKIQQAIDFAKESGIKTLFVQVYRGNQAWFPSKVSDTTHYELGLKNLSQDAFAFLIKEAHAKGIEVHAWLNLLSLGGNKNAPLLKKYGPSILTRNISPKKTLDDYKIDNQYFLEPSDSRVRQNLSILVGEVLRAYPDLDGIQFDYIRYPDVHPFYGYSKENVARFKKATGVKEVVESNPAWKQWKRDQVTELLSMLVKEVRLIRPHIHVSTTGCLSYGRAHDEALQDWPTWINTGLIEFVTVMDYPPDAITFEKNITDIKSKISDLSKLNIAVGAYKDIQTVEDFKGQFDYCQQRSGAKDCVLFHYDSLIKKPVFAQVLEQK